jgi:hypothetical protein
VLIARLFGPNRDTGNLILLWWRVQYQNVLSRIPAATLMWAKNANAKLRKSRQWPPETARSVLVIDVGGTHTKLYPIVRRQFPNSWPTLAISGSPFLRTTRYSSHRA